MPTAMASTSSSIRRAQSGGCFGLSCRANAGTSVLEVRKLVTLAEAREAAISLRKRARAGDDPLAERRLAKAVIPTFAEATEKVHSEHKASWRNAKHAAQWVNTLRQYAFPELGTRRVDQVATPDILRVQRLAIAPAEVRKLPAASGSTGKRRKRGRPPGGKPPAAAFLNAAEGR